MNRDYVPVTVVKNKNNKGVAVKALIAILLLALTAPAFADDQSFADVQLKYRSQEVFNAMMSDIF
jgi:hypothetical protein